jgi:phosphatidylglycerophosphate synthase
MDATFVEARREIDGWTAGLERRALAFLAARMPAGVGPDHLTALGLFGFVAAGASYGLAGTDPRWLHAVNLGLAVNWFGDSLDGTVARHRNRSRPRYGFYVDHMVDAFGALFLLGGLALSGLMSPAVAVGLLLAFYLMFLNVALATHTRGVFRIAHGGVGGTELRIALLAANLLVLAWPRLAVFGREVLLFDLVGGLGLCGLVGATLLSTAENTRALFRLERL